MLSVLAKHVIDVLVGVSGDCRRYPRPTIFHSAPCRYRTGDARKAARTTAITLEAGPTGPGAAGRVGFGATRLRARVAYPLLVDSHTALSLIVSVDDPRRVPD